MCIHSKMLIKRKEYRLQVSLFDEKIQDLIIINIKSSFYLIMIEFDSFKMFLIWLHDNWNEKCENKSKKSLLTNPDKYYDSKNSCKSKFVILKSFTHWFVNNWCNFLTSHSFISLQHWFHKFTLNTIIFTSWIINFCV